MKPAVDEHAHAPFVSISVTTPGGGEVGSNGVGKVDVSTDGIGTDGVGSNDVGSNDVAETAAVEKFMMTSAAEVIIKH